MSVHFYTNASVIYMCAECKVTAFGNPSRPPDGWYVAAGGTRYACGFACAQRLWSADVQAAYSLGSGIESEARLCELCDEPASEYCNACATADTEAVVSAARDVIAERATPDVLAALADALAQLDISDGWERGGADTSPANVRSAPTCPVCGVDTVASAGAHICRR